MKNLYPKIKFIHSFPYDRMLTGYENKTCSERRVKEVGRHIKRLQIRWSKINNSAFRTLETIIKNKWQEKEIRCYVVKHFKYSGISNPLTIKLAPDFDFILATLIH